ncbi:MAG: putative sugar O-methyltransferase [Pedobacter sp.]|nr:MAG: putative sugar O-methyltransferase [Pedobacter sp.]
MLKDVRTAPPEYAPTNYWSVYEKKFVPELNQFGLKDFRKRQNSVLSSFGATDLISSFDHINLYSNIFFYNGFTRKIPFYTAFLTKLNKTFNTVLTSRVSEEKQYKKKKASLDFASNTGKKAGAKHLESIETSLVGNPEDVFEVNGKNYTRSFLYYYLRYVYCYPFVDFDKINTLVELGSGAGKQTEVLKKLYPHLTIILFDIPPQLYVCERYLSTVFPDSVVSYKDTRDIKSLQNIEKGKIYILGTWQFPLLNDIKIDIFWNAASFQEMEPDVVANYLKPIDKQADLVFLQEEMGGKEVAHKEGKFGVLKKTTLNDYKKSLSNFELVDLAPTLMPTGGNLPKSSDSFWRRKE